MEEKERKENLYQMVQRRNFVFRKWKRNGIFNLLLIQLRQVIQCSVLVLLAGIFLHISLRPLLQILDGHQRLQVVLSFQVIYCVSRENDSIR